MPINVERIRNDIAAIGRMTLTPGAGATRPTFSPPWRQARDYIQAQLEAVGCKTRIDAAANLHARPTAISWDAPAWMSGSHLDTIAHGGDYDGVAGIVTPLEVFRAAREDLKVAIPLELVVWTEEEGTTFGQAMIGSRTYVGEFSGDKLISVTNPAGQNYVEAGAEHGVDLDKIPADRLRPTTVVGLIEVHVEQGPGLWNAGMSAACVSGVRGRRQYHCELRGAATHAGATSMRDRLDAMAGAAEAIVLLEKLARDLGHDSVITVGRLSGHPNSTGVVAGRVEFTIDFRSSSTATLAVGDQSIHRLVERVAQQRGLEMKLDVIDSHAAVEFDPRVCAKMKRSATSRRIDAVGQTVSGVFHDAGVLARHVPAAMLFVPSRQGLSHCPQEFARPEDLATAAQILMETVRDRRLE